jgi:hypothetical protein
MKINFQLPMSAIVVGAPKQGKSHLIRYILSQLNSKKDTYQHINYMLLFTKTKFTGAYNDIVPKEWQYNNYNENAIKKLMSIQESYHNKGYKCPPALILFDDCLSKKDFQKQSFLDLLCNYRHYNISIIISAQYLLGNISTTNRECISQAFIFKLKSYNSLNGVYNSWFTSMANVNNLREYMTTHLVKPFRFIYVDNDSSEPVNYCVAIAPGKFNVRAIKKISSIPVSKLKIKE